MDCTVFIGFIRHMVDPSLTAVAVVIGGHDYLITAMVAPRSTVP